MSKPTSLAARIWNGLSSLKLTIVLLAALMVLVFASTIAQVRMGLLTSVNTYIRSFVVWWPVPGTGWSIAVFPGGATVGLLLALNLVAAQLRRLELSWKRAGLWIVHAGLILLFVGEFASSLMQVDAQMAILQGQTLNYVESTRDAELAVIDTTDPGHDDVYSIPESRLARGGTIQIPGTPIALQVKAYLRNAVLTSRGPVDPPSLATVGVGPSVTVTPAPPVTSDDDNDTRAAFVEPFAGGRAYGTWLVSTGLGAPQSFTYEGRTYVMKMRPRRYYLPYSITLKKFSHDVYPGTDIPKNFSSLVHITNKATGDDRDVLIYMNQPLRYDGKAFYQASFGRGDTLSILQVVSNPGWLLPYFATALVGLGLLVHFAQSLARSLRRRQAQAAAAALEVQ